MDLINSSPDDQITSCPSKNYNNNYRNICAALVMQTFNVIATTLLALLLPLSFLLLARIATTHYLLSIADNYPTPTSFLSSLLLLNPTILHLLISLISMPTFIHILTNTNITFLISHLPQFLTRHRLFTAWVLLTIVQVCVGLGLEGSIIVGIDGSGFGQEMNLLSKVMFFLGLHETMLFWWRAVVKLVVDDTIFGVLVAEGWVEKVAIGVMYGGLWWGRLREEVEALVVVPELKRELMMGIGLADFVGWWLYYLTVTIGMVRVVKGLIRMVAILTRRRVHGENRLNDEKV